MSGTISSSTSFPNLVTPSNLDAVPTAAQTPTQRYTPLWLVNTAGSTNGIEAIGLRAPSANGDLAVLLAEVSLSLEKSVDDNNKNKGLTKLAALAGALAGFGLDSLRKSVDNKTKTVDESTQTLGTLTEKTSTLLTAQQTQNTAISTYRTAIGALETELAKPGLSNDQRASLEAQLASVQGSLNGALVTRQGIDIQLANARIESLGQQIADLQTQLDRATPDSTEAVRIQTVLDGKIEAKASAVDALDSFEGATKTPAVRDAFSASTRAAVQATTQNLTLEVQEYQTALKSAMASMAGASGAAAILSIFATAMFNRTQAGEENSQAERDSGIESAFEAIADALEEASKAMADRLAAGSDTQASAETDAAKRARVLAQALLSAVSDLVNTLANQVELPSSPMAVPRENVANRLRVTI